MARSDWRVPGASGVRACRSVPRPVRSGPRRCRWSAWTASVGGDGSSGAASAARRLRRLRLLQEHQRAQGAAFVGRDASRRAPSRRPRGRRHRGPARSRRRIRCTASIAACRFVRSAMNRATAASPSPSAQTSSTMPMACNSAGAVELVVGHHALGLARADPLLQQAHRAGARNRPNTISGNPNVLRSSAMMRSAPSAISKPPPSARPCTRAIEVAGGERGRPAEHEREAAHGVVAQRHRVTTGDDSNRRRSPPTQKCSGCRDCRTTWPGRCSAPPPAVRPSSNASISSSSAWATFRQAGGGVRDNRPTGRRCRRRGVDRGRRVRVQRGCGHVAVGHGVLRSGARWCRVGDDQGGVGPPKPQEKLSAWRIRLGRAVSPIMVQRATRVGGAEMRLSATGSSRGCASTETRHSRRQPRRAVAMHGLGGAHRGGVGPRRPRAARLPDRVPPTVAVACALT